MSDNILGKIGAKVGDEIKALRVSLGGQISSINLNNITGGLDVTKNEGTGIGVSTDGKLVGNSLEVTTSGSILGQLSALRADVTQDIVAGTDLTVGGHSSLNSVSLAGSLSAQSAEFLGSLKAQSLEVKGDTKIINTQTVEVSDNILELNKSSDNSTTATVSGIEINRGETTVTTTTEGTPFAFGSLQYPIGLFDQRDPEALQIVFADANLSSISFSEKTNLGALTITQADYNHMVNGTPFPVYEGHVENDPDYRLKLQFSDGYTNSTKGSPTTGWRIYESENAGANYSMTDNALVGYLYAGIGSVPFAQLQGVSQAEINPLESWLQAGDSIDIIADGNGYSANISVNFNDASEYSTLGTPTITGSSQIDVGDGSNIDAQEPFFDWEGSASISLDENSYLNAGSYDPNMGPMGIAVGGNVYDVSRDDGTADDLNSLFNALKQGADEAGYPSAFAEETRDATKTALASLFSGSLVALYDFLIIDEISDGLGAIIAKLEITDGTVTKITKEVFYRDDSGVFKSGFLMEFVANATGSIESVKFTNQARAEQTFTASSSARGGSLYTSFATDWGTPISYTANTPQETGTSESVTTNDKAKMLWDNAGDQQRFKMMIGDTMADLSVDDINADLIGATQLSVPNGSGILINNVSLGTFADFQSALTSALSS